MLLFFTASERSGILGKTQQMKVIQWVAAAFSVFVRVQMHRVFCSAFWGDPFQKCLRSRFALGCVSLPLSIWTLGIAAEIPATHLLWAYWLLESAFWQSSDDILFHCIWTRRSSQQISANESYSVSCSSIYSFYSGSDALDVLQCLSVGPFPEVHLQGRFVFVRVSLPLSIWTLGITAEILTIRLLWVHWMLESAFWQSSDAPVFHCIWTRWPSWQIYANESYSVSCNSLCSFRPGSDAAAW